MIRTAAPAIALTYKARLPYKPRATANGDNSGETDLPTQQTGAKAPSRLSRPHEDQGRTQGRQCPPNPWPQAPDRLGRAKARVIAMERLRQRADFLAAASGIKAPAATFVLQMRRRREDGPVRVGFTVSKRVGNAVERNRVRRRLREIVRLSAGARLKSGHDYVLIGRRAALDAPFERIREEFDRALRRVHATPPGSGSSGTNRAATPHGGGAGQSFQ